MATWDSYTQKSTPADADTLMIKDTSGGANKRTPFSGVWNWILTKLTNAVISQLETTNKSIIPAINELNSKSQILYDYTLIPENADMDSYRSYGTYGCSSNNVASTLKNDPFQTAFKLSVESSTGVNDKYVCQIYRRLYDGAIAYRYLNDSNEWSNYYYLTPTKNKP